MGASGESAALDACICGHLLALEPVTSRAVLPFWLFHAAAAAAPAAGVRGLAAHTHQPVPKGPSGSSLA
jgi:hypothetical protein